MIDVYVGIGSNVEPERHLQRAVEALAERFGDLRRSAVYRSPAIGFDGPDFLNMAVVFATAAEVDAVEQALTEIEYEGGRVARQPRFSSRTLDLDLLLYGAMVDARLRVPRDDIERYPFVLAPLAELAPALRHPLTGRAIGALWASVEPGVSQLRRVGELPVLR